MAHRETGPHDDVAAVTGGAAAIRERSRSPPPVKRPRTINVMGNELVAVDLISCPLCRLEFPSHRALCGHMNAHRNRGWRGMNTPPGVNIEDLTEYNDDEVEKENNNAVPEEENIEVNIPAEDAFDVETEVSVTPVEVPDKKRPLLLDLNKSPPPEDLEQESIN